MKLIFKTTSGGFSYPVKSKYQQLFLNILLFIIFILFIYCCIVQVVDINFFIRLLVVYSFVYIYRLVRYIAVHLILSTIESLPSIEAKRLRLLHLNALYHKLNVYYYLWSINAEYFANLIESSYDFIDRNINLLKLFSYVWFFLLYYPLTRLHLMMLKFVDLVISKQCKLLEFKFETYIITIIFILPFTLLDYRYIFQSIGLLITYYYFLSALLLPLASYIFAHFEYTLFYPSAAFVSKQRKPVHIIATVISCYPEDVLFESHTDIYYYYPAFQTFTPVKFTITFICHSKFFFHDIGIYDMRTASFIHFYFGILNKERFFINYNYPLYCWYIQLHKYIEQNWRNCYSWNYIYSQALQDTTKLSQHLLQFYGSLVSTSCLILKSSLYLIWDIEEYWGLDNANTTLQSHMVYECFYCPINFGPFPLKKFKPSALRDKKLNLNGYNILKEKILSHIVNDYPEMVIAESIFNESGFCLISDFEPISNIDIASLKALANVQGQLKALAYIEIMNLAADFTKSKPLFINHKIYQEFSKNILKWRKQWEYNNK